MELRGVQWGPKYKIFDKNYILKYFSKMLKLFSDFTVP